MSQNPPVILQADRKMGESRSLRTDLRRRGAKVLMADTPEKAIELSKLFPPDVIVLDDDLSQEGGTDLVEHFRTEVPDAEIILLSSQPESMTRGVGRGLLFQGLRPVTAGTLLDLITTALPGRWSEPPKTSEIPPMVLCVDDDRMALNSLSRLLGRHGYRVSTFQDPRSVLQAIPEIGPDVAVLDVVMPDLDGRELSQQIRSHYRGLFPIVMYSARSSDAERLAGFRHGADYYLPKPCEPHQILDVVDYYADRLDPEERQFLESRL
jgi:DNA-binding response OmpR family regulator